jgi:hypothetical protein
MQITTIGLDIAKNVFQVHGIDAKERWFGLVSASGSGTLRQQGRGWFLLPIRLLRISILHFLRGDFATISALLRRPPMSAIRPLSGG